MLYPLSYEGARLRVAVWPPARGEDVLGGRYRSHVSITAQLDPARVTRSLARHHPLGASTGIFDEDRGDWPTLVRRACEISSFAVELSALAGPELISLSSYLAHAPRLPFRYVSVHAPAKALAEPEAQTVRRLGALPLWVRSVVVHPDALVEPQRYRALGTRLVLENMDARKPVGRSADELEEFFEVLPDAGFCFDIAHAHSLDPSMELAEELLHRYGSRLRQVHLSSLIDGEHVPLRDADARSFAAVLDRCRDVPWILEARPPQSWEPLLAPAGHALELAA